MISRLDPNKYPTEDPKLYLTFLPGVDPAIDPVFASRLAAFAKTYGVKLSINSGYRAVEKQIKLFLAQGGKYDTKIGYYWPANVPAHKRTVAKPGKSFHNFRLAIDTNSPWAKLINKDDATAMQKELLKFGIFKPMTKGNSCSVLEDWHIQPIETLNVPVERRKDLMPIDESVIMFATLKRGAQGDTVIVLQYHLSKRGYKLNLDGDFGAGTEKAVKDFQKANNLQPDGIVGTKTWDKLYGV